MVTIPPPVNFESLNQQIRSRFGFNKFSLKYLDQEGDAITLSSQAEFAEALKDANDRTLRIIVHVVEETETKVPELAVVTLPEPISEPKTETKPVSEPEPEPEPAPEPAPEPISEPESVPKVSSPCVLVPEPVVIPTTSRPVPQPVPAEPYEDLFSEPMPCVSAPRPQPVNDLSENKHIGIVCDSCGNNDFTGVRFKCGNCADYDLCEKCEVRAATIHNSQHLFVKIPRPIRNVGSWHRRPLLPHPIYLTNAPATVTATATATVTAPAPATATAPVRAHGVASSRFIADLSYEDGAIVEPGQTFEKLWKFKNDGTLTWTKDFKFIKTDKLSPLVAQTNEINIPEEGVQPGAEHTFSVTFTAPQRIGRHRSFWVMTDDKGCSFGHRVWCDVIVRKPEKQTPVVQAPVAEEESTVRLSVVQKPEPQPQPQHPAFFPSQVPMTRAPAFPEPQQQQQQQQQPQQQQQQQQQFAFEPCFPVFQPPQQPFFQPQQQQQQQQQTFFQPQVPVQQQQALFQPQVPVQQHQTFFQPQVPVSQPPPFQPTYQPQVPVQQNTFLPQVTVPQPKVTISQPPTSQPTSQPSTSQPTSQSTSQSNTQPSSLLPSEEALLVQQLNQLGFYNREQNLRLVRTLGNNINAILDALRTENDYE